jgi:hypothetical protein
VRALRARIIERKQRECEGHSRSPSYTLIEGSGGLRKLRIGLPGRGKHGGGRLIYYFWARVDRCYLLMAYAKSGQDDLTPDQRRRLAEAMNEEIDDG